MSRPWLGRAIRRARHDLRSDAASVGCMISASAGLVIDGHRARIARCGSPPLTYLKLAERHDKPRKFEVAMGERTLTYTVLVMEPDLGG